MESEDQILRQLALEKSPVKRMTEHLAIPITSTKNVIPHE